MSVITFTAQSAAHAVKSYQGDKGAALSLLVSAVLTATVRTVLHGDAALFKAMVEAAESRKGAASKALVGRINAADASARELRATIYPEGRKGKADAAAETSTETSAGPIADAFESACTADAGARSEKAKAGAAKAAETKAAKAKAAEIEPKPLDGVQGTAGVITLAELIARIKSGESAALQIAQAVRGALNEFEVSKAAERAKAADATVGKAAKAAKAAKAKAAKAKAA